MEHNLAIENKGDPPVTLNKIHGMENLIKIQ